MLPITNYQLSIIFSRRRRVGFTLIEILVVITIIMVLASLALVTYQGARKTARDGRRKADLEQIRGALEIYRVDCNQYPATASLTFGGSLSGTGTGTCASSPYIALVPQDPLYPTYSYRYSRLSLNNYVLCAFLEGGGPTTSCTTEVCNCVGAACNYKICNP